MYLLRHVSFLVQLFSIVRALIDMRDIFDSKDTKFIDPDTCDKIDYRNAPQALAADTTDSPRNAVLFVETNFGVTGCHLSEATLNSMMKRPAKVSQLDWQLNAQYSDIASKTYVDLQNILKAWQSARHGYPDEAPAPEEFLRAPPLSIVAVQIAAGLSRTRSGEGGQKRVLVPYGAVLIRQFAVDIKEALKAYDDSIQRKDISLLLSMSRHTFQPKKTKRPLSGAVVLQEDLATSWASNKQVSVFSQGYGGESTGSAPAATFQITALSQYWGADCGTSYDDELWMEVEEPSQLLDKLPIASRRTVQTSGYNLPKALEAGII